MTEHNFLKQLSLLTLTLFLLVSAIGLASRVSPEKSHLDLTGHALTEPTGNTGSYMIPHSPQQQVIEQQTSLLLHTLPVSGNNFLISFDYYHDVFQITLYPPLETSKTNFLNYLQQNGYDQLPGDLFEFIINPTPPITPTTVPPTSVPTQTPTSIPTPTPIYKPIYIVSFIYNSYFVIKGSSFGQTGSGIPVTIEYSTQKISFNLPIYQEDYQTLYIPLSSLPGFSQTSLLTITIGSTRVVFPNIIFIWGTNLVLKNANFGQLGKPVKVHIEYGTNTVDTQANIVVEDQQVIYIPLSLLPGYVSSNLVWVSQ